MSGLKMEQTKHSAKHRYNLKTRFEIVSSLGHGTYGKVKLATDKKTGQQVAIKSIAKRKVSSEQDLTRIRREIEIMASLNHKHIIQILEVFENKEKIIIVMEYADGGELYDYISSRDQLSEKESRRLFRQIVSAVHHLHENGIVHRDLKLENILLDKNGQVKIADFGLSNTWHHNCFLHTFCGSPLYASPEIVNGRPYYGPEVDCWSLGVLLYTLVYGAMPFDGSDFQRLKKQISTGNFYNPREQSSASSLIKQMLTVNPAKRANITDIVSHWWTNKDCSRNLEDELASHPSRRTSDYFEDNVFNADETDKSQPERIVTPVFDSTKKPRKGILKKRNVSGGDSGCALSDNKDGESSISGADSSADSSTSSTPTADSILIETRLACLTVTSSALAIQRTKEKHDGSVSSCSSTDLLDFSYESPSDSNTESSCCEIIETF